MPVEVTRWMARDGTYHDSQEAAAEYEAKGMIVSDLRSFLSVARSSSLVGDNWELADLLYINRKHLLKILNGDHN